MATSIKIIPTLHGESARRFIERAEEVERNPQNVRIYSDSELEDYHNMLKRSGMLMHIVPNEVDMDIDEDDPWLYEEHEELSPLPGNKEHYTLEELREILINDLDEAYAV